MQGGIFALSDAGGNVLVAFIAAVGSAVTILLTAQVNRRLKPNGNKPIDQGGTVADAVNRIEGSVELLRIALEAHLDDHREAADVLALERRLTNHLHRRDNPT